MRLARTALAALLALPATLSCRHERFYGPNLMLLDGTYVLRTVNGDSVPRGVSTSYTQGTVTSGVLTVDGRSLDYWLTFTVRKPDGTREEYLGRGWIEGRSGTRPDTLVLTGRAGQPLSKATVRAGVLTAYTLRELRMAFQRTGGYRPAS